MLREAQGDLAGAGFACLGAAWECDDDEWDASAVAARRAALELFDRARALGQPILWRDEPVTAKDRPVFSNEIVAQFPTEVLLVELCRRVGDFAQAQARCRDYLQTSSPDLAARFLQFQLQLIQQHDTTQHFVHEAFGLSLHCGYLRRGL